MRRIRGAVTVALNSSGSNETSPGHGWRGWGREDDEAIAIAVEEALTHAGDSVYDEIGGEIVAAAARGDEPTHSLVSDFILSSCLSRLQRSRTRYLIRSCSRYC